MKTWYKYKDIHNKTHRTCGRFIGWMVDGLGIRRAIFALRTREWLIPDYCLLPETKEQLRKEGVTC